MMDDALFKRGSPDCRGRGRKGLMGWFPSYSPIFWELTNRVWAGIEAVKQKGWCYGGVKVGIAHRVYKRHFVRFRPPDTAGNPYVWRKEGEAERNLPAWRDGGWHTASGFRFSKLWSCTESCERPCPQQRFSMLNKITFTTKRVK